MGPSDIREDLAAFADDDEGFALDDNGDLLIHRGGVEIAARIETAADGSLTVSTDGGSITYRDFLVRQLGQLDVLATRLLEKRPGVSAFVDARASVETADGDLSENSALSALEGQCADALGFRSRVCFITADAGQGKTALLREYQAKTAEDFLAGRSPFVFWHVDLQGRQLLRLSEALMGDLGDLRVAGLWMPAVLRLIRHRALILAIDGFDELAAEQGGSDALGSLATLVQGMDGHGVVLAASRRAFFDTSDYLRRAGIFGRAVAEPCEFNQITLLDWTKEDALSYLSGSALDGQQIQDPKATYSEIVAALGGSEDHPMVTKPFLLSHIARGLLTYDVTPAEFVKPVADPMAGVASVVEAFVAREVAEKWRYRDSGEPYLTRDQHIRFLADVAEEMYRAGKDRLQIDLVETLASMRLEEWSIAPDRQRQVMEMVRMHALLRPPSELDAHHRAFDHPEFRDYFIAIALSHQIESLARGQGTAGVGDYLSIAQLSDSAARYIRSQVAGDVDLVQAAKELASAADRQVRSTFLQVNAGTLIPVLVDGAQPIPEASLVGRVVYSSLVFEGTVLRNLTFEGATLLNVSLRGLSWSNVCFSGCELGELSLHDDAVFDDVLLRDCSVDGVKRFVDGHEVERAYTPSRVRSILADAGFVFEDQLDVSTQLVLPDTPQVVLARRFLQAFTRSNVITEEHVGRRFRSDKKWVLETLIPIFEQRGVLEERTWRGKGTGRIWSMKYPLGMVLEAEEGGNGQLGQLWDDLRGLGEV